MALLIAIGAIHRMDNLSISNNLKSVSAHAKIFYEPYVETNSAEQVSDDKHWKRKKSKNKEYKDYLTRKIFLLLFRCFLSTLKVRILTLLITIRKIEFQILSFSFEKMYLQTPPRGV